MKSPALAFGTLALAHLGIGTLRYRGWHPYSRGPRRDLAPSGPDPVDRARDGRTSVFTNERSVLARPTGVGRALATYTIPIEGRDEWLAAARRLA
jgi:hypothetical protein